MNQYDHRFTRDEADQIVRQLNAVSYARGPGIELTYTFERGEHPAVSGTIAFLDENPDSFSVVRDGPPGNEHVDLRWDEITSIAARWT
jgi:hypothetical protein